MAHSMTTMQELNRPLRSCAGQGRNMQLCNRALPTACLYSRKVRTAGTISCRRPCGLTADLAQFAELQLTASLCSAQP